MKYAAPPYMYDVLPYPPAKEAWLHTAKWRYVEGVFREVCRRFGYREIRTPIWNRPNSLSVLLAMPPTSFQGDVHVYGSRRPQHDAKTGGNGTGRSRLY